MNTQRVKWLPVHRTWAVFNMSTIAPKFEISMFTCIWNPEMGSHYLVVPFSLFIFFTLGYDFSIILVFCILKLCLVVYFVHPWNSSFMSIKSNTWYLYFNFVCAFPFIFSSLMPCYFENNNCFPKGNISKNKISESRK